ncbi:uncharacterized protein LOC132273788 isoform X3 [Cornus florida]|uniref:uncharacterized protein LOC132273788 isoform X3 n=1 Tax=Cornus florida TaxID=4283 RepID=UPI00289E2E10|nr:uncharacterized protein LOC132273788 isoform X3 [Cornus florida]
MQFNNSSTCSADLATVGEDLPVDYADWLPKSHPSDRRRAGVLLHPTSFPGPYGIGDLGDQTFRFLDWLHELVPLVPPGRKANEEGFPYSGQVEALAFPRLCCIFCLSSGFSRFINSKFNCENRPFSVNKNCRCFAVCVRVYQVHDSSRLRRVRAEQRSLFTLPTM